MTEKDALLGGLPPAYPTAPLLGNDGSASTQIKDSIPSADDYPKIDPSLGWSEWKDRGFAIAFWVHAAIVFVLAFALGIPAIRADAGRPYDDQSRTVLDYNADLFIRVFTGAAAASGCVTFVAFFVLQRCAGRIIKCSLYMGVAMQIMFCISLFIVAWPMGIITLIFVLISLWYIYYVRNRIAFAEAHIQVGCAALRSHPGILLVAVLMLVLQLLWVFLWGLMALGFEHTLNGSQSGPKSNSGIAGGLLAIVLLTSLFWGALVFRNITHFVTACVVGQWWFIADSRRQYAVDISVQRAFTTNFGTISFGSLILAFIKALRVIAQINESNARRDRNIVLLLLSCCAVCILRIFEGMIRYLNEWAFVFSALTGQSFRKASQSFLNLFEQRGWTMIINDDLAGSALTIVTLAIGIASAFLGGVCVYVAMPHSPSRAGIAGMAALFCFAIGIAMGTIMASILSSGVRTAFVCFAINPRALGETHPDHLQNLLSAWYQFHPQEFATSGFGTYFPQPLSTASNIYTGA